MDMQMQGRGGYTLTPPADTGYSVIRSRRHGLQGFFLLVVFGKRVLCPTHVLSCPEFSGDPIMRATRITVVFGNGWKVSRMGAWQTSPWVGVEYLIGAGKRHEPLQTRWKSQDSRRIPRGRPTIPIIRSPSR